MNQPRLPTDQPPGEQIIITRFLIDVLPDKVLATIDFVSVSTSMYESRQKAFDLSTPFVDILENVPDVFSSWKPVPYRTIRFPGES